MTLLATAEASIVSFRPSVKVVFETGFRLGQRSSRRMPMLSSARHTMSCRSSSGAAIGGSSSRETIYKVIPKGLAL